MKKLLIGLSNNVALNKEKIKIWVNSFKRNSDARIVLLVANPNDEDKKSCENLNIEFKEVRIENTWFINHKRLEHIINFLKKTEEELVLATDVFDVVFQKDPFEKLDLKFDFFAGGEGVNVNQEPWNRGNVGKLFPEEVHLCDEHEVVCSGVVAGKRNSLIKIYERMFELCEKSPDTDNIKDQAALILMLAKKEVDNIKIFNLDEAWAVHCAVAGPTQFFESWGFKDSLKYGIPKLIGDEICTGEDKPFDIVHQFNRIPEWNEILINKYKE